MADKEVNSATVTSSADLTSEEVKSANSRQNPEEAANIAVKTKITEEDEAASSQT